MNKKLISFVILFSSLMVSLAMAVPVKAVNPFDVSYPITELGDCGSQSECKAYCDDASNGKACFEWAANNGFVSEREVKRVRNLEKFEERNEPIEDFGPGGCRTPKECDNFCRVEANLEICLQYGVEHGYTTQEDADKAREKANKKGPGGCSDRESCDNFCRNPQNTKACMQFAVDDGKISQEEADFLIGQTKMREMRSEGSDGQRVPSDDIDKEKAKKMLEEVGGPGGCSNFEECDAFCGNPDNSQACMDFAIKNGLIPPEKVEKIKKMNEIGGPGGCRGPKECDAFCSQPGNGEICMNFSIENGLMPLEEIERMKKEMEIIKRLDSQGGPGGCDSKESCNAFCSNSENTEECMKFGSEKGIIRQEEADNLLEQRRFIEKKMIKRRDEMTPQEGMIERGEIFPWKEDASGQGNFEKLPYVSEDVYKDDFMELPPSMPKESYDNMQELENMLRQGEIDREEFERKMESINAPKPDNFSDENYDNSEFHREDTYRVDEYMPPTDGGYVPPINGDFEQSINNYPPDGESFMPPPDGFRMQEPYPSDGHAPPYPDDPRMGEPYQGGEYNSPYPDDSRMGEPYPGGVPEEHFEEPVSLNSSSVFGLIIDPFLNIFK